MLARLLQLASPTLPVGAYSYSQGLEWAVESGEVKNEATALRWIGDQLEWNIGRFEAPMLVRLMRAWKLGGHDAVLELDASYLASRETAELRAETLQMGYSMLRLLNELGDFPVSLLGTMTSEDPQPGPSFVRIWSCAAVAWDIPVRDAVVAWLWSWAENQTMAALKAVPLGQAAGQRLLRQLGQRMALMADQALSMDDDALSNFAPGFAIACSRHEAQYSRLFRS